MQITTKLKDIGFDRTRCESDKSLGLFEAMTVFGYKQSKKYLKIGKLATPLIH